MNGNNTSTKKNLTVIADPVNEIKSLLQGFGVYDALIDKFLTSDYPIGTEEEYIRHYLFGVGKPFINFLVFVDVGTGFDIECDFGDDNKNIEIKEEIEQFLGKIKWQTSLIQFATYREVLGRGCIVKTRNLGGEDFYFNELEGITGVDVINPMSLEQEHLERAIADTKGKEPYHQSWVDFEGEEHEVDIEQDRVIYSTLNPFSTKSPDGVSSFANCINDLRVGARFARYKSQVADKSSRMHRHFIVDTEKFGQLKQGKDILESKKKSEEYLYSIHRMINSMNEKGSDVATMDYILSKEVTYAGKIPDITSLERGVFESIATKMEIPINTMTYGADVNRATLEVLSDIFVRRRESGSQLEYIRVTESIIEEYLMMKGIEDGEVHFKFKKFLPEDLSELMTMVGSFVKNVPGVMSDSEIRKKIQMPEKIEYGEADDQKKEQIAEIMKGMQPNPNPSPTSPPKEQPSGQQQQPEQGTSPMKPIAPKGQQSAALSDEELNKELDSIIFGLKKKYEKMDSTKNQ